MSKTGKSALSLLIRSLRILVAAVFLIGFLPAPAMAANGTITGQVTDNATGNPIVNAELLFFAGGSPDYFRIEHTDASGQYSAYIPEGTGYEVAVSKTAYFPQRATNISVAPSPDTVLNFSLIPGGAFIGEITDSVEHFLINGAFVRVFKPATPGVSFNATTDDLGIYSITVPPDSGYAITVNKAGYLSANITGRNAVLLTPTTVNIALQQVDSTPPGNIIDLVAGSPTPNSISLTWTASGDDGNIGLASYYEIRRAPSIIGDENAWNNAQPVPNVPAPLQPGTIENFVVTGLSANTTYFFAVKTRDDMNLISGLSNSPSATTLLPPSFFITHSQNRYSFMLAAGANITETFNITSLNNFTGTINLNFGGPPEIMNNSSVTPNQVTLAAGQTQTVALTIGASALTPSGSYQCGLNGQTPAYGGQQRGAFFTVIIGVPGQPLLSASPPVVGAGGQTNIFAAQFPATSSITLEWDSGPNAGQVITSGQTTPDGTWNVPFGSRSTCLGESLV